MLKKGNLANIKRSESNYNIEFSYMFYEVTWGSSRTPFPFARKAIIWGREEIGRGRRARTWAMSCSEVMVVEMVVEHMGRFM